MYLLHSMLKKKGPHCAFGYLNTWSLVSKILGVQLLLAVDLNLNSCLQFVLPYQIFSKQNSSWIRSMWGLSWRCGLQNLFVSKVIKQILCDFRLDYIFMLGGRIVRMTNTADTPCLQHGVLLQINGALEVLHWATFCFLVSRHLMLMYYWLQKHWHGVLTWLRSVTVNPSRGGCSRWAGEWPSGFTCRKGSGFPAGALS